MLDGRRTAAFVRGSLRSIQEAERRFAPSVIEVLYAGTGPFAPLASGFWLSFVAVGVILYALREPAQGLWRQWGRAQLIVSLGLLPLLMSPVTAVVLMRDADFIQLM